jgi:hypothetical protein
MVKRVFTIRFHEGTSVVCLVEEGVGVPYKETLDIAE